MVMKVRLHLRHFMAQLLLVKNTEKVQSLTTESSSSSTKVVLHVLLQHQMNLSHIGVRIG